VEWRRSAPAPSRAPRAVLTERGRAQMRRRFTSQTVKQDAAIRSVTKRDIPVLQPGDRVSHDSFGLGSVVAVEGVGDKSVASIDFGTEGVKRLLLRYAPIEKL